MLLTTMTIVKNNFKEVFQIVPFLLIEHTFGPTVVAIL